MAKKSELPNADEIKKWSTSQLIIALNQCVIVDVFGKAEAGIDEFKNADRDQIKAFTKIVEAEIDARIPRGN